MTPGGYTATALVGFADWYALLTVALGAYRTSLVLSGRKAATDCAPDASDVSPFGRRLNRARDNCYETLPLFAALALGASLAGKTAVTDPLAMYVLYARIAQSVTHIASTNAPAVFVRFAFFLVQVLIYATWAIRLLSCAWGYKGERRMTGRLSTQTAEKPVRAAYRLVLHCRT